MRMAARCLSRLGGGAALLRLDLPQTPPLPHSTPALIPKLPTDSPDEAKKVTTPGAVRCAFFIRFGSGVSAVDSLPATMRSGNSFGKRSRSSLSGSALTTANPAPISPFRRLLPFGNHLPDLRREGEWKAASQESASSRKSRHLGQRATCFYGAFQPRKAPSRRSSPSSTIDKWPRLTISDFLGART